MPSIESSPYPLVFRVAPEVPLPFDGLAAEHEIRIRTLARALDGMQKEAVVLYGPSGAAWRMVCDEGPYLNGTDLAPFPLAFFTAGLACSYLSELDAIARRRGVAVRDFVLEQDNYYTMEGSALKGTMTGGAQPVELVLSAAGAAPEVLEALLRAAVAASPADALLRTRLASEFTVTVNGARIAPGRVRAWDAAPHPDPAPVFDALRPAAGDAELRDLITKVEAAETVTGVEGGAGTSLSPEQRRTLHVHGRCAVADDGLKRIDVRLFRPIGSSFRFLAEDSGRFGGGGRAPSGLAWLSAGIAFCYMTQIARYAHIAKKDLRGYRIVQDTVFGVPGASAHAAPVRTHVYIESSEPDEEVRHIVDMGEQTCFLHAACRQANETRIRIA